MTVSIGVALVQPGPETSRSTLFSAADKALYEAKHAGRDRVTTPAHRKRWMGLNGGVGSTLFVDGMLEGLWRVIDGRVVVEPFRWLTRSEEAELDEEIARVEALLAR